MFIRESKTKNKKTKTTYITHKLVENYRSDSGVRQRVIMSLGTLDLPKKRWRELAAILEARITGQTSFLEEDKEISSIADIALKHNTFVKKQKEEKIEYTQNKDMQMVDLNSASTSIYRSLGPELVANTYWNKLEYDHILSSCGLSSKQISIAKALIIGRLIAPGSEIETWRWFQSRTSLIEMTSEDLAGIGKDSFYEMGDILLEYKENIEKALFSSEKNLFDLPQKVFLYDLTNTYFEGKAKRNDKASLGHSKEKRTDCPLVTLALLVDELGFPVFSQIYEGGKSEPKTLEDVLEKLQKDTGELLNGKKPVLIMDRGIATKKNIELISKKQYPFTVINRRQDEKDYQEDFEYIKNCMQSDEIPEGWESVNAEKTVYVKKISSENTSKVLSVSVGRTNKERGMDSLKEERFLTDIGNLKKSFEKGNILQPIKVGERIGKIKNKYPTIGRYYDIAVELTDDNKKVKAISWSKKPDRDKRTSLNGCYVIETTQTDLSAIEVWKQYMQLTRIESAFQDLKSELGLRPVYHQKTQRTESHLFIGVLAYHLLNSIEHSLRLNGDTREWKTIKGILSTHQRCTIFLKDGVEKVYSIRNSGKPEAFHNDIYRTLNIKDSLKRKKTVTYSRL